MNPTPVSWEYAACPLPGSLTNTSPEIGSTSAVFPSVGGRGAGALPVVNTSSALVTVPAELVASSRMW